MTEQVILDTLLGVIMDFYFTSLYLVTLTWPRPAIILIVAFSCSVAVPAALVATFRHLVPVAILDVLAVSLARVPHVSIVPVSDVSMTIDLTPPRLWLCPLIIGHHMSISDIRPRAVVREVARAPALEAVAVAGPTIDCPVIHPHGPVIREGGGCPGAPASAGSKASAPASWRPLRQRGHSDPARV